MSSNRRVELVRVLLGNANGSDDAVDPSRPAASVFPTESKKPKKVDEATIAAALGGKTRRFVSEAELAERKDQHGESLEDGTFAGRTLTEAIIAQREAKQRKIEDDWKTIKQGKNRPLEADEIEFLDTVRGQQEAAERAARAAEEAALRQFRAAQADPSADEQRAEREATAAADAATPAALRPAVPIKKKPVKLAARLAVRPVSQTAKQQVSARPGGGDAGVERAAKAPPPAPAALGLLGAYDSDDEDDEDEDGADNDA